VDAIARWLSYTDLALEIRFAAMTRANILISGEPGVGKIVVARLVHAYGPRPDGPFESVCCAGVTEEAIEVQLFGRVERLQGGQRRVVTGSLEKAQGGTLHLEAIGELGRLTQDRLLAMLHRAELGPADAQQQAGFRTIATADQHLFDRVRSGQFRDDLYYYLNVIHLVVPPLRARRTDIPALATELLSELSRHHDVSVPQLTSGAVAVLQAYEWPGNIRELRCALEHLVVSPAARAVSREDFVAAIARPSAEADRTAG
jgi:DNA-binding NtrC family response regulator